MLNSENPKKFQNNHVLKNVQCIVYIQYMGHTLSNVLVKYVREHSGDICPIHEQYYGSSLSHIWSMVLLIYWQYLKFLRGIAKGKIKNYLKLRKL